jgi:hypothetical protein
MLVYMPQKTLKRTNKKTLLSKKRHRRRHNKSHKRASKNEKPESRMAVRNTGFMTTITRVDDKTSQRNMDWNAKYNGKEAVIHANLDVDGKKAEIEKRFNKDEIGQLLGIPTENKPLENRLQMLSAPNDANMEQLFAVNRPMNTRQFTVRI